MNLTMNDITKEYSLGRTRISALRGLSFALEGGRFYALVGPSGSGKSTLIHVAGCMERPDSGSIQLDGEEIGEAGSGRLTEIRARHIGFVFQSFFLTPFLGAAENVAAALIPLGRRRFERMREALRWLDFVGLADRARHKPHQLSGGERQRVAVARALAKQPSFILADEPTGNLDSENGARIVDLLHDACGTTGATVLLVTHNRECIRTGDTVLTLRDGRLEG
jgi:putative ABC transport system ATP-binding protein